MQPLIAPITLITDTWKAFVKTWDATVRISVWFIVVGVISAMSILIPQSIPGYIAIFFADILGVLISIWAMIRLYRFVFSSERNEAQQTPDESSKTAMLLIWPLLITQALVGLTVLGGIILLILPGIYIGVRLAFAQAAVIDPKVNKSWTDALRDSWDLTQGKFWAIFGRLALGGICFGLLIGAIVVLSTLLVGVIAGADSFLAAAASEEPPPAVAASLAMIQSIAQAALLPLTPIFQVKLYQSLRQTM